MNWIDRTIATISPKWGYSRFAWRESLRAYDAGSQSRLNAKWTTVNNTAEQTNQGQRDILRARARDLERNSDILEAIISPFERNVVGTGIIPQAKIMNSQDEEDEDLNNRIEALWKQWCLAKNCDVTGQQCFDEMQAMAIRRKKVDGGIIFVKCYTADGIVPFCLQAKEVDELDTSYATIQGEGGNRVVGGIELNEYNKPVAYYFKRYTPEGYWTGKSERIEAKRVLFLFSKKRPSQIREVSEIARTMPVIKEVNEFVEAISVKERILACLSVFIKKINPSASPLGRGGGMDKQSGYPVKTISPGMVHELQPGEDVTTVNPSGQASNARDFIMTQQRIAGAGQGLSYEVTSRDMSQVNYSSARQGLLEDQRTYKMEQQYLIDHFCKEVYTEFIISAVLCGKLKIKDFWENKEKYLKHDWITPGWSWIDPMKEVNANIKSVEAGFDTLANVCGARGMDWKEIMQQRKKEQDYAKEMGLLGKEENNDSEKENIKEKVDQEKTEDIKAQQEEGNIQQTALNGAQISSLIEIINSVKSDVLTYESAVALIIYSFPFDESQAKEILGEKEDAAEPVVEGEDDEN